MRYVKRAKYDIIAVHLQYTLGPAKSATGSLN